MPVFSLSIRDERPDRIVVRSVKFGQQVIELAGREATGPLPPTVQDGSHLADAVQRPLEVCKVGDACIPRN